MRAQIVIVVILLIGLISCRKDEVSPLGPEYVDDGSRDVYEGTWNFTKTSHKTWGSYVWVSDDSLSPPYQQWQWNHESSVIWEYEGSVSKDLKNTDLLINFNNYYYRPFVVRLFNQNEFHVVELSENVGWINGEHQGGCREITDSTFCLDLGTESIYYGSSTNYKVEGHKVQ